ncbi:hypothetical protein MC885_016785, partial [Smutsia gigantea]
MQEQQSSLQTLREAFASQEQLQRTQNQLLQLIRQGWKVYRKSLYYFSHVKKSWHDTEQFCMSQGAHLASVTSEEEQGHRGLLALGFGTGISRITGSTRMGRLKTVHVQQQWNDMSCDPPPPHITGSTRSPWTRGWP